jgi:hypothetical protein
MQLNTNEFQFMVADLMVWVKNENTVIFAAILAQFLVISN